MAIQIEVIKPKDLDAADWSELHDIYHSAFEAQLGDKRSQEEIDYLTNWGNFDRFHASHVDPNTEVGGRFNPDQSYSDPRVALATDGNDFVGFGYSANNVSGNVLERAVKLLGTAKKYHWLREFVVQPEYQRQGIATQMANLLIARRSPYQSATAYIWPDEIPFLIPVLQEAGFQSTGNQQVKIYGENSEPIRQLRMLKPGQVETSRFNID